LIYVVELVHGSSVEKTPPMKNNALSLPEKKGSSSRRSNQTYMRKDMEPLKSMKMLEYFE
jgi:hypothetical protein